MAHCDAEALALAALGEPALDARDAQHLLDCRSCVDELARLQQTVRLARGPDVGAAVPPAMSPPARIWEAVVVELGLAAEQPVEQRAAGTRTSPIRLRWLGVAAAAVLLASASGLAGAALRGGDSTAAQQGTPPSLVAQAALLALAEDTTGSASWFDSPDGAYVEVAVSQAAPPSADADYLEVWLLDPATGRMVSLGPLPAGARRGEPVDLTVPAGIGPTDYPFVDVSREPLDGDPAHSGHSLSRGQLIPTR